MSIDPPIEFPGSSELDMYVTKLEKAVNEKDATIKRLRAIVDGAFWDSEYGLNGAWIISEDDMGKVKQTQKQKEETMDDRDMADMEIASEGRDEDQRLQAIREYAGDARVERSGEGLRVRDLCDEIKRLRVPPTWLCPECYNQFLIARAADEEGGSDE